MKLSGVGYFLTVNFSEFFTRKNFVFLKREICKDLARFQAQNGEFLDLNFGKGVTLSTNL